MRTPPPSLLPQRPPADGFPSKRVWQGFAFPLGLGLIAWQLGTWVPILGAPVIGILLGLLVGQLFGLRPEWKSGLAFCSRKVLQSAIVLLGAGMSLGQVAQIGSDGLPVMIGTLAIAIGGGALLGRMLRVERQTGVLVTYGTAICGASAIATMSAVIGASSSAIAFSITVIVIYNVLGALLFPPLGHLLGLSQEAFGLWAGTAVNDTSSVVAAATVYGAAAASYAVVVKLTRTLAIIPLAVFESWRRYRSASGAEQAARPVWYKLAPPFLGFFLLAAALNSFGAIPPSWQGTIKLMAHFGTTAAMAAVGMTSSFAAIRQAGWRPIALGGILWVLVATSSLLLDMIRTAW